MAVAWVRDQHFVVQFQLQHDFCCYCNSLKVKGPLPEGLLKPDYISLMTSSLVGFSRAQKIKSTKSIWRLYEEEKAMHF